MGEAPKEIWAGPDEKGDWGVLRYGEDMFWETPENSVPEDREGLTHYTRTDAITPAHAAKVLLDAEVGLIAEKAMAEERDRFTEGLRGQFIAALRAIAQEDKQ